MILVCRGFTSCELVIDASSSLSASEFASLTESESLIPCYALTFALSW